MAIYRDLLGGKKIKKWQSKVQKYKRLLKLKPLDF